MTPEKVLVVRFSSLGDIVLTTPVFAAIKEAWPAAQITALTKRAFADVLISNPRIDHCMALEPGESLASIVQRVRAGNFDVVIDLHGNWRSRIVSLFSGAPRRVRYRKAALARRLYVGFRVPSAELKEHTLDRYLDVLPHLGIPRPAASVSEKPRFLVIQTAFLGDAVLTTPLLTELRRRYSQAYIAILCTPAVRDIFVGHPGVNDVFTFDKRGADRSPWALVRWGNTLRKKGFEMVFIPHRSLRSALLAWLAGIPRRIGFSSSQGRFLLSDVVTFQWEMHDADRNLALLSVLGPAVPHGELYVRPSPEPAARVRDRLVEAGILPGQRLLGINAGSVWATKRWLPERFAAVADLAADRLGLKVVFFGGPKDRQAMDTVSASLKQPALDWVGKTSLAELIAGISLCEVFLTNDSGPMHIAVALGVPTVAIFGPTTRELGFFPYGEGHIVIERDLNCRPCGLHGAERCPLGHFRCMKEIEVQDVFNALVKQLPSQPKSMAVPR